MTELAIRPTAGHLTVSPDQTFWTDEQALVLRQAGVDDDVTAAELTGFLHLTQRTGLDPFSRQIYLIGRWDTRAGRKVFTPQTAIDGYRVVRDRVIERTNGTLSYDDFLWCGPDGAWHDVWLDDTVPPIAAKVTVYRNGGRFSAVAKYTEYVQTKKGGDPTGMWVKMPASQLAKCAEALALRKAFPHDLAGVYTAEEMAQADNSRDDEQRGGRRQQAGPVDDQWTTPPSRVIVEQQDRDAEVPQVVQQPATGPLMASEGQRANVVMRFGSKGITDRTERLRHTSALLRREVESFKTLTFPEYQQLAKALSGGWPHINPAPAALPDLPAGMEDNEVREVLVTLIADAISPETLKQAGEDIAKELARGTITPAEAEYLRAVWKHCRTVLAEAHGLPTADRPATGRPAPVGTPDNPGIADYQRRMLDSVGNRQQHTPAAMVELAQRHIRRDITDLGQLSKAEADRLLHTLTTGEKPAMAGAA